MSNTNSTPIFNTQVFKAITTADVKIVDGHKNILVDYGFARTSAVTMHPASYVSALNSLMVGDYQQIEGLWLFLKLTVDFIRTQPEILEAGYAIGGDEMRMAVETGLIARTKAIKNGELYRLAWNGSEFTTFEVLYIPVPENKADDTEFAKKNRNSINKIRSMKNILMAFQTEHNVRILYTVDELNAVAAMKDNISLFNNDDLEGLAAAKYAKKEFWRNRNDQKDAAKILARATAQGDEGMDRLNEYINSGRGVSVRADDGTLTPVDAAALVGKEVSLVYPKTGRSYQNGMVYSVDASNLTHFLLNARKAGLAVKVQTPVAEIAAKAVAKKAKKTAAK